MKGLRILLLAWLTLFAPLTTSAAQHAEWTFGTEVDLVPYLNGGYYASAIAGKGRLRGRIVRTELTVPSFATEDAFRDNDLEVWAAIVDIYFRDGFSGWWVGPGLEVWDGTVTEKASGERHSYRTNILTLGGGYTWRFSERFYLNPWAAIHIPVGGDREVGFPAGDFELNPTPEASLKLGVCF